MHVVAPAPAPTSTRTCPGPIAKVKGIIFQNDALDPFAQHFIRPVEVLDQWWGGLIYLGPSFNSVENGLAQDIRSIATHAGTHVVLEDGREYVVEQLLNGWRDLFLNALYWTPIEAFRARSDHDAGGWELTVPLECFREFDEKAEHEVLRRLPVLRGRSFLREDCTGLIARIFGGRRVFADSPVLRTLGIPVRSGGPALPLIRQDQPLPEPAEKMLRGRALRTLPDPLAKSEDVSVRQLHERTALTVAGVVLAALAIWLDWRADRRENSRRRWWKWST